MSLLSVDSNWLSQFWPWLGGLAAMVWLVLAACQLTAKALTLVLLLEVDEALVDLAPWLVDWLAAELITT